MKLGIVGSEGSGKTTLFSALTGETIDVPVPGRTNIGSMVVGDHRLERMRDVHQPKKYTPARLALSDFPALTQVSDRAKGELLDNMRGTDVLLIVGGGFDGDVDAAVRAVREMVDEFALADLQVIEKRLEKLEAQSKRGIKLSNQESAELDLMARCQTSLEDNGRLVDVIKAPTDTELVERLRLFTEKPKLAILNVGEEGGEGSPTSIDGVDSVATLNARIEAEIAAVESEDDRKEFLEAYQLEEVLAPRLTRLAFEASGLICFFTVGQDEVRAWPITRGTSAVDAAGKIHSDLARGFIRAEVIPYETTEGATTLEEFKRTTRPSVEGRDYVVQDADILNIRFNV